MTGVPVAEPSREDGWRGSFWPILPLRTRPSSHGSCPQSPRLDSSRSGRPRDGSPRFPVDRESAGPRWDGMWPSFAGRGRTQPPERARLGPPISQLRAPSSARTRASAGEATGGLRGQPREAVCAELRMPTGAGPAEARRLHAAEFGNDIFTVLGVLLPRRVGG